VRRNLGHQPLGRSFLFHVVLFSLSLEMKHMISEINGILVSIIEEVEKGEDIHDPRCESWSYCWYSIAWLIHCY
jgi:hypothetical protein